MTLDWRHFKPEEFSCHNGVVVPEDLIGNLNRLVVDLLDPVRESWGQPIIVISGYRTVEYNTQVGGAKESTHLQAKAADIRPLHLEDVAHLYRQIRLLHEHGHVELGGIGLYPQWIHVDTRKAPDGHLRRWLGRGIGTET